MTKITNENSTCTGLYKNRPTQPLILKTKTIFPVSVHKTKHGI